MKEKTREDAAALMLNLNEKELIELNKMVIRRIKAIRQIRYIDEKLKYHVGQKVQFKNRKDQWVNATVDRINTKTISITETDSEQKWRVGFTFIRPAQ